MDDLNAERVKVLCELQSHSSSIVEIMTRRLMEEVVNAIRRRSERILLAIANCDPETHGVLSVESALRSPPESVVARKISEITK
jgi:5-methylcytosine-specific restriction endonuclease McrBC regulatory subunit McrC